MAKVLVVGATGYIGFHLAEQLGKAGIQTTALVRNPHNSTGDRKEKLEKLKAAGVKLVEGDADADSQELVQLLKSHDTVVTALSGQAAQGQQLKLVEAAKQAGTIKRFVPSEWGGEYAFEGKHAHLTPPLLKAFLSGGEKIQEALKDANIAHTKMVVQAFFGWNLPTFGEFTMPGTPTPAEAQIYGDGTTKGATTDEADIGRVLAKVVDDPRTLDKKVVIRVNTLTQNELVDVYEKVKGKKVQRKAVSAQELDKQIEGADTFPAFILSLAKAVWIGGAYQLPSDEVNSEPFVIASELYPDIKFRTVENFYQSLA